MHDVRPMKFPDVLAPFVPTPRDVVDRMLRLAGVGPDDLLYDLGCGDGRIVVAAARDFGARAIGFDTEPGQEAMTLQAITDAGVASLAQFRRQDIHTVDLARATVITLYLSHFGNHRIQQMIKDQCRPGTRIVSHSFPMHDWPALTTETITTADGEPRTIFLWHTPAP